MSLVLSGFCIVVAIAAWCLYVFIIAFPASWSRYVKRENAFAERAGLPRQWSKGIQRGETGWALKAALVALALASLACAYLSMPFAEINWGALEAIGTLAVAVLAIWGDWIRSRIFKPNLSIDIDPTSPFCQEIGQRLWIRLRVRNDSETPAEDVEVWLDSLERKEEEEFQKRPLIPLPLSWTHNNPYTTVELRSDTDGRIAGNLISPVANRHSINGHRERYCNFGAEHVEVGNPIRFSLDTVPRPADWLGGLHPGTFRVTCTVTAKNSSPITGRFQFKIPENWPGGEKAKKEAMDFRKI